MEFSAMNPNPEKRKPVLNFDGYVALATVLIALFLIVDQYRMPKPSIPQTLGPGFVPIAVLAALIFASILVFYSSVRSRRKPVEPKAVSHEATLKTSPEAYRKIALVVLGLVVYAAILIPVGFTISTALLILWEARLFEKGKWVRNLIVGSGFSVLVYYVFLHILEVMLPEGIFGF